MPQVITTILLDGNPKGFRKVQIGNWNGEAYIVPRGSLKELRERKESQQPGIYFLFGEGEEKPRAYIGQSENVLERLLSHNLNREEDEWDNAFVFVGDLDSTFIKYLESITVNLAKKANRCALFNSAYPRENRLSEAQKIIATEYLENIKAIISLFGYSIFDDPKQLSKNKEIYTFDTDSAMASGSLLENQQFIVYKNSTARIKETESFKGGGPALRKRLIDEKVLEINDNDSYMFICDYLFTSPSAAGDTVAGRSVNGWRVWKNKDGKTLSEVVRGK